MNKASNGTARRGVTLTEMTVVLALISLVSLLVISFTGMVNLRSSVSVIKNRAADDLRLTKVVLENWTAAVTDYGAEITVADDGKSLVATIGMEGMEDTEILTYNAFLTEDGFTAKLPNGETLHCPIGEIVSFTFEIDKKDEPLQDEILFCTAEYSIPKSSGTSEIQTITFCINSHVGDIV